MAHFTRVIARLAFVNSLAARLLAQSPDIMPSDNLVAEGVPPIPAQIATAVSRYTEFRSASFYATVLFIQKFLLNDSSTQ